MRFFNNSYNHQKETIHFMAKTIWLEKHNDNLLEQWSKNCHEISQLINQNSDHIQLPQGLVNLKESELPIAYQKLFSLYDSYIDYD